MNSYNHLLESKSIAIVRTDRLGDMVLTLPIVNALKEEVPGSEISVIAAGYVKPLLERIPGITKHYLDGNKDLKKILSENNFDTAFFPMPVYEEALAARKAGIKLRVGSAFRLYSILFNHRVRDHRKVSEFHEAEYNVRMVSSITGKDYRVSLIKPVVGQTEIQPVFEKIIPLGFNPEKKFIIIHPGSRGSAKDWQPEKFAELNKLISHNLSNYQVIISGTSVEQNSCKTVADTDVNTVNLCGKLSLDELIVLMSSASLLIANSTGVLHIAASLEIPSSAFFQIRRI
jgi:heptosyltransferase-3